MPGAEIELPVRELQFSFSRSSGPGGQRVNKANTKVTLRWNVEHTRAIPRAVRDRFVEKFSRRISADGDLVLTSQRYRDQGRNVADCMEKLRSMLREVARPAKRRRKTRRPRAAIERRLASKRETSRKKHGRRRPGVED